MVTILATIAPLAAVKDSDSGCLRGIDVQAGKQDGEVLVILSALFSP
jgi:hypothetical protein